MYIIRLLPSIKFSFDHFKVSLAWDVGENDTVVAIISFEGSHNGLEALYWDRSVTK